MASNAVTSADGRVRVARIITRLNVGGPALHAMLLAARLDPSRYDSTLIVGRVGPAEGAMHQLRPVPGVRPVMITTLEREISPLGDLVTLIRLIMLLRRYRPQIVHTHLAKAGLLGRIAARLVGTPVVVHTFHGNVLRGYFAGWQSRLFLLTERLLARITTRIIAISPQQQREIVELGIAPPEKVVEIPLGLDLQAFAERGSSQLRSELGLRADAPLVTAVARLEPIKGVDVFVEAAAAVARVRAEVQFLVVGDGAERVPLERLVDRLGLSQRVRFLGWRPDLPDIYAGSDVIVLTSHNEGTPVSLIEALAAGRAVVATNVGGVPDLLGASERGVLVPDGDIDAIGRAIGHLLSDPARREELGRRGQRYVRAHFDVARLIADIDLLYRELLDRRALRP